MQFLTFCNAFYFPKVPFLTRQSLPLRAWFCASAQLTAAGPAAPARAFQKQQKCYKEARCQIYHSEIMTNILSKC